MAIADCPMGGGVAVAVEDCSGLEDCPLPIADCPMGGGVAIAREDCSGVEDCPLAIADCPMGGGVGLAIGLGDCSGVAGCASTFLRAGPLADGDGGGGVWGGWFWR